MHRYMSKIMYFYISVLLHKSMAEAASRRSRRIG